MKHKNCHARSKDKRRKLKLKNFWRRVFEKRTARKLKALKTPGVPFVGVAKKAAPHVSTLFPSGPSSWYFNSGNRRDKDFNQRQKRKRARWETRGKKAA